MSPAFAAFPEAEHRDRLERARAALRAAGLSCCVCVAPEHLFYFGGYDSWVSVNSPQALIFTTDPKIEPVLIVRNVDLALPRETSWVKDIRTYHLHAEDVPARIAGIVDEMGFKGGDPGGVDIAIETQTYALTYSLGLALAKALAPNRLVDCTDILGATRLVKSPGEIAYLRTAGRFAEAGLAAARKALKPGITEIALAAHIEGAMRHAGSDYWSIPTELASGPRSPGGHATARDRVIESGDLVHLEFAGVARRYHAAAIHTLVPGKPSKRAQEIYELSRLSLQAGIAAIRPGAGVADVEEASLDPLRKVGLDGAAMMRFGYGIGIAYPPIWLEPLQISRGFSTRLAPGMVFVLHAYLQLIDEGIGVLQGGTYLLTETGLDMLAGGGDVPLEIV